MTRLWAVFILLSCTQVLAADQDPLIGRSDYIQTILSKKAAQNIEDSVDALTEVIVEPGYRKYQSNPTGDGPGLCGMFDPRPIFNQRGYDCTTYVEGVMALTRSKDILDFTSHLLDIKYSGGNADWFLRNHFAETDWIPNNIAKGYLKDISAQVLGEKEAPIVKEEIKKRAFFKFMLNAKFKDARCNESRDALSEAACQQYDELNAIAERQPESKMSALPYVPMKRFVDEEQSAKTGTLQLNWDVLRRIPSGTVFSVVNQGWKPEGFPSALVVEHQGFIVWKTDEMTGAHPYVRHASGPGAPAEIVDTPLEKFLEPYLDPVKNPHVVGLNLLEIVTQKK